MFAALKRRSRSTMDSTWVSGTQDTGSIPVETTILSLFQFKSLKSERSVLCQISKWQIKSFPSLKPWAMTLKYLSIHEAKRL